MPETTQTHFAAGLLDQQIPVPGELTARSGAALQRRYGVYRNNVLAGLVQAISIRFPVVEKIVGREFFAAMAREFVTRHPPCSPVLIHYGAEFPDFIEGFAPARELAYLPDVARLENARMTAYHAADAATIDVTTLLNAADAGALGFRFHPAVSVVQSKHPVLVIWGMNDGSLSLGPIDRWEGEDVLVARPQLQILMHRLPPGGVEFIKALMDGEALYDAVERAIAKHSAFDTTANLVGLLGSGAVMSCTRVAEG
jgi:hypothetical protein